MNIPTLTTDQLLEQRCTQIESAIELLSRASATHAVYVLCQRNSAYATATVHVQNEKQGTALRGFLKSIGFVAHYQFTRKDGGEQHQVNILLEA